MKLHRRLSIWRKQTDPVSAKASGGAEEKAKALETALAQMKSTMGKGPSCGWDRMSA